MLLATSFSDNQYVTNDQD